MLKRLLIVGALFVTTTPACAHDAVVSNLIATYSTPEMKALSESQQREIACTALAVYHESKGQPERGQSAVAHVIQNRVANPKFPNTACGVVFQRWRGRAQFVFINYGPQRLMPRISSAWKTAVRVSIAALHGNSGDPTNGAKFFRNVRVGGRSGMTIGAHIFTK